MLDKTNWQNILEKDGQVLPKRDACTRAEFDVVIPQDKEIIKINEPSLPGIHNKYGVLDKNTGDISLYKNVYIFGIKQRKFGYLLTL